MLLDLFSILILTLLWSRVSSDISSRVSTVATPPLPSTPSSAAAFGTSSHRVTVDTIAHKLQTKSLPIFEFGRDLELLEECEEVSSLATLQLYQQYVDALRDFYYQDFINRCQEYGQRQSWCDQRDKMLREAELAMRVAMPKSKTESWSFESQLEELRVDMDSTISGAWDETEDESKAVVTTEFRKHHWLWNAKNKKRLKWVLAQCILLVANFVQYEWHRRSARRAAQKRLAEVPEFPLL